MIWKPNAMLGQIYLERIESFSYPILLSWSCLQIGAYLHGVEVVFNEESQILAKF